MVMARKTRSGMRSRSGIPRLTLKNQIFGPKIRGGNTMPRFSVGARVRVADEKTNDRVGTVVEIFPSTRLTGDYDAYRVELNDGSFETISDLQLSPAGAGP